MCHHGLVQNVSYLFQRPWIGHGSIIDEWGYDRLFCSSSSSDSTTITQTKQHTIVKFCKNVDICHLTTLFTVNNPQAIHYNGITCVSVNSLSHFYKKISFSLL